MSKVYKMTTTLYINKLLTFKEEDIKIYNDIRKMFDTDMHVCLNWDGHIFTGTRIYTKETQQI